MNDSSGLTNESQVLDALGRASKLLGDARRRQTEPIAIIGMACRFPGADDLDAFWNLLDEGRSGIRTAEDRWDTASLTSSVPKTPGKMITDRAGLIEDVDQFDSRFFEITRREASSMDPQQRLLLEMAWRTLEHAGIPASTVAGGRHGVFVGMCSSDYLALLGKNDPVAIDAYHGTGNAHGAAAGRLSYFLKWNGPSLAIDTACSSSMVAVHQAIGSLRSGECEMALAAGVNLILTPDLSVNLSQAGMLSPRGECQAFAESADGFVRGEGCGAVLLKPLRRAIDDGDRIIGCIRGSAINQDGRSNGLTAPNGLSQQNVIRAALKRAGIGPEAIDYVEAHGTGTQLGDPIEMRALGEVFANASTDRPAPLRVGSVKTNIGHLEGAAGIAGLLKVCLSILHESIPPHLHFDRPSQHIEWSDSIEVTAGGSNWPVTGDRIRRSGISSFGFGGTNAHLIVEEYCAEAPTAQIVDLAEPSIVKLSARSPTALDTMVREWAEHLPKASLSRIAAAANLGRDDFPYRRFVIARSRDQLIAGLRGKRQAADSGDAAWQRLEQIGDRYVQGEDVDWRSVTSGDRQDLVSLPGHPFMRQRCWFSKSSTDDLHPKTVAAMPARSELLGAQLDIAGKASVFETDLSKFAFLNDHRIGDQVVFPASGFVELGLAAAKELTGKPLLVCDLQLKRALVIDGSPCRVACVVEATNDGWRCSVEHRDSVGWRQHATMVLRKSASSTPAVNGTFASGNGKRSNGKSAAMRRVAGNDALIDAHFEACHAAGIDYGPTFRGLVALHVDGETARGVVRLLDLETDGFSLHPALLDACFQVLAPLVDAGATSKSTWLPVSIDEVRITDAKSPPEELHVVARLDTDDNSGERIGHLEMRDSDGHDFCVVRGLRVRQIGGIAVMDAASSGRDRTIAEVREKLANASDDGRAAILLPFAQQMVAEIGELELDEIDPDVALTSLGIDSIMAIELQNVLEKTIGTSVPMELFLKDLSLAGVIDQLAQLTSDDCDCAAIPAEQDAWVEGAL